MFKKYALQTSLVKATHHIQPSEEETEPVTTDQIRQIVWYYKDAVTHTAFAVGGVILLKTVCKIAESRLS